MFGTKDINIRFERWNEIEHEVMELASMHWEEVEGNLALKRPMRLKIPSFRQLDSVGLLRIAVARKNGKLIGYCSWMLQEDIESAGNLMATQGAIFVSPGVQSGATVYAMLKLSIKVFKRLGVNYIFLHHRMLGRGTRLGLWFYRLQATLVKKEYYLWIGD